MKAEPKCVTLATFGNSILQSYYFCSMKDMQRKACAFSTTTFAKMCSKQQYRNALGTISHNALCSTWPYISFEMNQAMFLHPFLASLLE